MKDLAARIQYKLQQSAAFVAQTKSPLPLVLDALRLTRSPFAAETKDGIKLRMNPRESFTFYENLVLRQYLDKGMLSRGDTVVDIGANIGSFTVLAATIVGPSGRVIAYEPIPTSEERLQANIALNSLSNVTCWQAAIEDVPGPRTMFATEKSAFSTGHILRLENDRAKKINIEAVTMEQVFQENHLDKINFLKIDCEGSEYGIFETMSPQLAKKIDQIAMEVHAVRGHTFEGLANRLRVLGFELHQKRTNWFAHR